ncbi:MAG: HEAT repeat domain-containing protein [Planctomycetota bacterium]
MNDTIRSILAILEQDKPPELKIAAAQVLGELAPQDPGVVRTLAGAAGSGEDYLARPALLALGAIRSSAAIKVLLGHLEGRHADLASHVLREIGPAVAAEIEPVFSQSSPEVQARLMPILASCRNSHSLSTLETALFQPINARRAADLLVETHLDGLDARQRKSLQGRLAKAMKGIELSPETRGALLCVVARLDGAAARETLMEHVGAQHPVLVRAAALRALKGVKLTPTQSVLILDVLSAADAEPLVEPAVELLRGVPWSEKAIPALRNLLDSPDVALRRFALEAMKRVEDADVVKPLLAILHGSSEELAGLAADALGNNPHARDGLLRSFLAEKDAASARRMLQPLSQLMRGMDEKQLDALVERGTKALLVQDPLGELVLELVARAGGDAGVASITDKAVRLRKQKKLRESVALFALLAHMQRLDPEGRFQLAVTRLLLDEAQPRGEEAPVGNATMGYFALLIREGFPMLERVRKESAVTPEAMLRIGQHFCGGVGEERRLGVDLLAYVAQKFGKRRAGEEAKVALRAEGY